MTRLFQCDAGLTARFLPALGLWLFAAAAVSVAQQPPLAVEQSPNTDDPYHQLRRSKDRQTQLLADRYFGLVRVQEWSDAAGKTVKAKYKSHDPDLKWVKLEVARGRGAERTVKEFQYPVEKLSKASQSRVRQIDAVQKRLDEEAAAAPAGDDAAGGAQPPSDPGAPMLDERGEEPRTAGREREAPPEPRAPSEPPAPPAGSEQSPAADEPFDPDPLGFAEMDLGPPVAPAAAAPPTDAGAAPTEGQ